MLQARRRSDRQIVTAYSERKDNGPFVCIDCGDEVSLKSGHSNVNHFAHVNPLACFRSKGESDEHRRCKMEIFEALKQEPGVQNVALERALGTVRPDVSAYIKGVPVAIEVQLSSLSVETITKRTIEYFRKGIYVLWLLPWTAELEKERYTPSIWEKWIHAAYFGRVYYWRSGLSIAAYAFDPVFTRVPSKTWYSRNARRQRGGGYNKRSARYRTPRLESTVHLARDFVPKQREWWEGTGVNVPDAKLFIHRKRKWN